MKWTFAQWGLLVICVFHVAESIAGFIAEPSFATGPNAPTASILGMDFNGWHAVAGLALFAPGLVLCCRNSWAVAYLIAAGIGGAVPGIWALFSPQVFYVLHLPNNIRDAIVHLVTGAVMIAVAAIQIKRDGGWHESLGELSLRS